MIADKRTLEDYGEEDEESRFDLVQRLGPLAVKRRAVLLKLAAIFAGIVVILLLWILPKMEVAGLALCDKDRFDRENEARKTLAQILGGVFLLAGLYSSVKTFKLSRDGQITDRFTKAIEQLGAVEPPGADGRSTVKLAVRLGAIYALERIAHDSERDHWSVMEVLTAYVRENSPRKEQGRSMEDIQAILTVINRRNRNYDPVDLPDAISAAFRQRIVLAGAFLAHTNLREAYLSSANLRGANLIAADLRGAHLDGVILDRAKLGEAHLNDADLRGANLQLTDFSSADLRGANLTGANLTMANLGHADLTGTINLTQRQIDSASGDEGTVLPSGLNRPELWTRR
jgi:hypothetical protein